MDDVGGVPEIGEEGLEGERLARKRRKRRETYDCDGGIWWRGGEIWENDVHVLFPIFVSFPSEKGRGSEEEGAARSGEHGGEEEEEEHVGGEQVASCSSFFLSYHAPLPSVRPPSSPACPLTHPRTARQTAVFPHRASGQS